MKRAVSYTDAAGRSHLTPEAATVSDVAGLLINERFPQGAAEELGAIILARRSDLERIFREHDEAVQTC